MVGPASGEEVRVGNRQIAAAREYHQATKHSYDSVRSARHWLDWETKPLPFKIYPDLHALPLPPPATSGMPLAEALRGQVPAEGLPSLESLAHVLYHAGGITKRRRLPDGGALYFRAAACTGALYHIELYVICGDLPGLPAGVYHFGVHDLALRRLREGDYRGLLVRAGGSDPALACAPAILACTSVFWRNAWKYRARAYRHAFWDGGTLLANLLAAATAQRLPHRLLLGFVDREVNRLLAVDPEREAAIALVALGCDPSAPPGPSPDPEPVRFPQVPYSAGEVDYPAIGKMHRSAELVDEEEVRRWRAAAATGGAARPGKRVALPPAGPPSASLEEVILLRGSSRRFRPEPIPLPALSVALEAASAALPADFPPPEGGLLADLYLIALAVEGLPAGAYAHRPGDGSLEPLKEGRFRREASYLALEQELAGQAAVNAYFLADLDPLLQRLGNRGYRCAQLEAGIRGGRMYLAAYAQELGATGLTFYDDEVTRFFGPHAEGKSALFLLAMGVPGTSSRLPRATRVEGPPA